MSESQSVDTIGALAHFIRAARIQQGFTRDELANAVCRCSAGPCSTWWSAMPTRT